MSNEIPKSEAPRSVSIILDTPIKRGDQVIDKLSLRKPVAGELRGIALADLMRLDVGALSALLPRITSPSLTPHDVSQLELPDIGQLGGEVVGFFMTKADRASLPA
ncbi:MAG TPA: phage tail assembly protein [Lysobacter sp.]